MSSTRPDDVEGRWVELPRRPSPTDTTTGRPQAAGDRLVAARAIRAGPYCRRSRIALKVALGRITAVVLASSGR